MTAQLLSAESLAMWGCDAASGHATGCCEEARPLAVDTSAARPRGARREPRAAWVTHGVGEDDDARTRSKDQGAE
eukprot:10956470-Alexandrium_andersonii.AAC.1